MLGRLEWRPMTRQWPLAIEACQVADADYITTAQMQQTNSTNGWLWHYSIVEQFSWLLINQ